MGNTIIGITRREMLKRGSAGIAGILAAGVAPGAIVRSLESGKKIVRVSKEGGGVSAADYVAEGLVAMWDGIENAGWGIHDPNTPKFVELVSGSDELAMVLNEGVVVTEDAMRCLGTKTRPMQVTTTIEPSVCRCIECVMSNNAIVETYGASVFRGFGVQIGCGALNYKQEGYFEARATAWSSPVYLPSEWEGRRFHVAFCLKDSAIAWGGVNTIEATYLNGMPQPLITGTGMLSSNYVNSYWYGENPGIGGNASALRCSLNGDVCCVRLYSRVPTAAEVAYNYSIDQVRFNLP